MCDKHKFVQIHMHSSGSLLDGAARVDKLVSRAKELGHTALALTDHGGPQMLFDFYKHCKKNDIKPILGLEFYINNDLTSRISNKGRELEDKDFHQSVYIKNKKGYRNFCELTYRSFNQGFHYKPRIDFDSLFELKKGLMVTSSCMASKTSQYITFNRHKEAEEIFVKFVKEFGEDFYGEIQFNEVEGQKEINDFIIHLSKKYDVPLLIGGDVHYLNPEDNLLQDAIIRSKRAASNKDTVSEKDWVINARHLYFHDASDYFDFNKKFGFNYDTKLIEECFENSIKFSDKPNFEFETGKYHLPKIKIEGTTPEQYLDKLTWEGIAENIAEAREYGEEYTDEEIEQIEKQVEYELTVLKEMGLVDYMLIMNKVIVWCKENDIYVGPGRGCFLPDSLITLSDNSTKIIKDIQVGDKVKNHFIGETTVKKVWEYEVDEELIEIEFKTGEIIKCTKDHEIYTENRVWVKAKELCHDDLKAKILDSVNKKSATIKSFSYFNYKGKVYDLEVDSDDHSYNVENIVVHNSAAGSSVAWGLKITAIDPLKHGLVFERFINPYRKVMCDCDVDIFAGGRDKVLQFLISEFGQESVCNVATFGLYNPKSALQDMSRGLNKDTQHDSILMRKICKLEELDDTTNLIEYFDKIIATTEDREVYNWINENRDVIDFANRLQGQMRQLGVHAGGILVTPGPVYDFIPVTRASKNIVSAFKEADGSSKDLSELGLLKLDILGLKTLNVLKECVDNIKNDTGLDLSKKINHLDLTDKKILEYFSKGNNYGIFQMDKSKMLTSKIDVDSFDDIIAINAINRPGPLQNFLDKYGYWKQIDKGKIEISAEELEKVNKERYPFPFMEKVLSKTYGTLIYQEEIMFLVCEAAGMDLGEADSFRRGIAWDKTHPKYYTVAKYYEQIEKGMAEKGYSKEDAETFIKYCKEFEGYSFNKSHSCLKDSNYIKTKNDELVSIKNVKIGDEIKCYNELTKENEFNKVTNFFNQGVKKVYRIKTESGKILEATDDHLILTETGKYHSLRECFEMGLKIKCN